MAPAFHIYGSPIGWTSIALAVLASIGGFIFGYDTGQISDILIMPNFLQRFGDYDPATGQYAFSHWKEGLIVGMLSIGTLIGALLGSYISDWMGRRRAMSCFCGVFSVGILLQVSAVGAWEQVMIGRWVAGLGVGALSAAVPVYQSETCPKEIRGSLVSTYQLMITAGILVAYAICIGTRYVHSGGGSWRIPIAISWLWAIILGLGILLMPESPRWLMAHGKFDEARKAIAKVRGVPIDHHSVAYTYEEMDEAIKIDAKEGKGTWAECFVGKKGIPKLAYRTMLGVVLQAGQQLTGANYFFYYGASNFQGVGLKDSYIAQLIFGAINFVCTFFGIYVMERFGRRWPLIIGGLWQSAWLFAYASVGVTHDPQEKSTGTFLIVATALFIFGYASTWAPGIWILTGETFPTRTRQKQASLAVGSNWIWNFLIAFFTPYITGSIGFGYGYVFAGCNLAGAIFVFFFLYESSNLSLENVNKMYGTPGLKAWQSGKWVPPGHSTRKIEQEESTEPDKKGERRFAEHDEDARMGSEETMRDDMAPNTTRQKEGQTVEQV